MSENLRLSDLEQRVLDQVKHNILAMAPTADDLRFHFRHSYPPAEVRQAIAQLVSLNFISADEDLRYHAVGGEL